MGRLSLSSRWAQWGLYKDLCKKEAAGSQMEKGDVTTEVEVP